jgi:hypothetical protein
MSPDTRRKLETRLRRIAGQVSGLERMVGEDRYCVDILLQIAAVRAASAPASCCSALSSRAASPKPSPRDGPASASRSSTS